MASGLSRGGWYSDLTFQPGDSFGQSAALQGFPSCKVQVKWGTLPSPKMHISTQMHIC